MLWNLGARAPTRRTAAGVLASVAALSTVVSATLSGCTDCIGEFPPYDAGFAIPGVQPPWPDADSASGSYDPDAGGDDPAAADTTTDTEPDGRGAVDRDTRDPLDGWGPENPAPPEAAAAAGARTAPGVAHAASPAHRMITVSGPTGRPTAASPQFRLIREVAGLPPASP